jgi:hypothetical protein
MSRRHNFSPQRKNPMRTQLLNNSYQEFPVNEIITPHAVANYQRCFRGGDRGKLFFVTVIEYGLRGRRRNGESWSVNRFNAKSQFKNEHGRYFDVVLHKWDTIAELNAFFFKMFRLLDCIPYDE